jgi:hypothetical protein
MVGGGERGGGRMVTEKRREEGLRSMLIYVNKITSVIDTYVIDISIQRRKISQLLIASSDTQGRRPTSSLDREPRFLFTTHYASATTKGEGCRCW